jgi:hypothetical protein
VSLLRRIEAFTADLGLNRRLLELQTNIEQAIGAAVAFAVGRRVISDPPNGTIVHLGDLVDIRSGVNRELLLAAPGPDEAAELAVLKETSTGTITLRGAGSALIQGAATDALIAPGLYRYMACRGSYWRAP